MKRLQFWKRRRAAAGKQRLPVRSPHRQCQFEEMELRRLFAVDPLAAGAVPLEQVLQQEMVQLPVSRVENEGQTAGAMAEGHEDGLPVEWLLSTQQMIPRPAPRQPLEFPREVVFSSLAGFSPVVNNFPQIPFYGSSNQVRWTWHLSIINVGSPHVPGPNASTAGVNGHPPPAAWNVHPQMAGEWQLGRPVDGLEQNPTVKFGMPGAVPVVGDWNGDGVVELGVYHQGRWYLDLNGNRIWDDEDLWVELGEANDQPVVGDWDGDGKDDIGILAAELPGERNAAGPEGGMAGQQQPGASHPVRLRQRTMQVGRHGENRRDLVDHVFHHGMSQDTPVAGDWNGDGVDTIGTYRNGHWHLDTNGDGRLDERDKRVSLGRPGDIPVVGDWDGDGVDQLGVVRQGTWMLDSDANGELDVLDEIFGLGDVSGSPVAGDWIGDGVDQPGFFHQGSLSTPAEAPGPGL